MSYFLSICIPTYNGGENLKYNVNKLIKMQPEFGFEICVSDNASDDGTQEFMEDIIDKYDFVKYHRNEENYGFSYNLDYVLNMANGDFRWSLGDDDEINSNSLEKVINLLYLHEPSICVVNGCTPKNVKRVKGLETEIYDDKNVILSILGEHMAWISCLIFHHLTIKKLNIKNITNNALPHMIEIFRFLSNTCNLLFVNEICVSSQENAYMRYNGKILKYPIKDWYNVITFLKEYNDSAKKFYLEAIIKRVFTNKAILVLRSQNIINKQNINEVREELKHYPLSFRIKMNLLTYIPVDCLKYLYKFYKFVM